MDRKRVITVLLAVGFAATVGWAQQAPPEKTPAKSTKTDATAQKRQPLSAEQRQQLKKYSDKEPQSWEEFLKDWMTPKPVPKRGIVRIDEKHAYPHVAVAFKMEIVREDEETVWLRGLPPENPESPLYPIWVKSQAWEIGLLAHADVLNQPGAVNYVDFFAEPVPPPFEHDLDFEATAADLPDVGRWQMGFTMADMNEDGHLDLVFPPQRKSIPPLPSIFLGDGAGGFSQWRRVGWAKKVPFDYGGVAVADFNGDGHQDVAIAIHFKAQYVLYGNGEGEFAEFKRLPPPDPRVSSRAVVAADFNGDGRQDLAFLSEIDYDLRTSAPISGAATLWVLENRGNSWQVQTEGLPANVIGDVLRAADVDADGRPDLVLSSNTMAWRRLVFLNTAEGWQGAEHRGVLSAAYHYGADPAGDEVFSTFVQFKVIDGKTQARNGIVRYPVTEVGGEFTAPAPLVWDKERANVFFRLGAGDLNGDGRTDLVAARKAGGLEVFLQTESGELVRERSDTAMSGVGRAFSIELVDLDSDGRDDIVVGCTPQGDRPGGVYVWLTREAG